MGLGTMVDTTAGVLVAMVVLLATEVGVEEGSGVLQALKTKIIRIKSIIRVFIGYCLSLINQAHPETPPRYC